MLQATKHKHGDSEWLSLSPYSTPPQHVHHHDSLRYEHVFLKKLSGPDSILLAGYKQWFSKSNPRRRMSTKMLLGYVQRTTIGNLTVFINIHIGTAPKGRRVLLGSSFHFIDSHYCSVIIYSMWRLEIVVFEQWYTIFFYEGLLVVGYHHSTPASHEHATTCMKKAQTTKNRRLAQRYFFFPCCDLTDMFFN